MCVNLITMKVIVCLVVIGVIIGAVSSAVTEGQNLEKPCGSSTPINVDCVRSYFDSNAECSVITESDNEPVNRDRFYFAPSVGLTVVDHHAQLMNLNGTIERFYINKDSGNLVMTISFENVTYQSPSSQFHFIREGQLEPFRITESIKASYPYIATAVIPLDDGKITAVSVKEAMVVSDFPKPIQEVDFGPKISESSDPDVLRTMAAFKKNLPLAIHEIFTTEGPRHFDEYLQKHICDFGISLDN